MILAGELRSHEALIQLDKITAKNQPQWLRNFCQRVSSLTTTHQKANIKDLYLLYKNIYQSPFQLKDNVARTISYKYSVSDRFYFAERFYTEFNKNPHFKYQLTSQGKFYKLSLKDNRGILILRELGGLPISELDLSNSSFTTLMYIDTLPLKKLNLANSNVADLDFLWTCKDLEELNIKDSRVYNLDKLKHTSVHTLILGSNPVNLFSLKSCQTLEKIILPRGVYKHEYLALMKLDHLVKYSD